MRILYGVVGEGMGHAIRSRVVLEHLAARHDVHVVVSGRAHDYLRRHLAPAGPEIHRIWGLSIVHAEGAVAPALTALENLRGALGGLPQNVRAYFEIAGDFDPSLVISDYESWSWLFGKAQGLPVISLDNIQAVARCEHPPEITAGHEALYHAARTFTASKLPGCTHYLITTFFFPKLRKARTTLVPPLLRPEVLAARGRRTRGDHLLVYQTAEGDERLERVLAGAGLECRVYGLRGGLDAEVVEGELRFRPFSDAGFVADLASCRGVVASGGFTLMSEAVYLGKPLLSVPIAGQFEQIMNARWLAHLGYGRCAESLDAGALREFLADLPAMEDALGDYLQFGNEATFSAIDELLERGPEALALPG
jgi:uncharacterized protein (TIGR00661 family)